MTLGDKRVLLFGYGNPGRLDDGLGPALAQAVAEWELPEVTVDCDYQLMVEDSATVAGHESVIFADASLTGREPFFFERLEAGVFEWNPASCRVLEKNGFEYEGRLRCNVVKDGTRLDTLMYGRLRSTPA